MTAKQENRTAGASAPFFAAWYGKAWILGVMFVVAGVGVYLSRNAIANAYRSTHEAVLGQIGLAIVPLGIWSIVLVWALVRDRSMFSRPRLWLASLGVMAMGIGAMNYFQPVDGRWAWFTVGGQVPLAGRIGEAVAGPVAWL